MNELIKQETKYGITQGYKSCPAWLKVIYRKSVGFTCQICNKHEKEVGKLTPHRKIRGNAGGLYTVAPLNSKIGNVQVICKKCHNTIHSKEEGCQRK